MHVMAIICGIWLNVIGDIGLCAAGLEIAYGKNGCVIDPHFQFRSRASLAFELLPVPVVLSLTGLILARVGFLGY